MAQKCVDFCKLNEKFITYAVLVMLLVGVTMTLTAFLIPIEPEYVIDPNLSAQENENREMAHARMLNTLYVTSAVGMGLLTFGAIITSIMFTKVLLQNSGFNLCCLRKQQQLQQQQQQQQRQQQHPPQDPHDQQQSTAPTPEELHSWAQTSKANEDDTNLIRADHLEMNRDFANVKPYGSVGQ